MRDETGIASLPVEEIGDLIGEVSNANTTIQGDLKTSDEVLSSLTQRRGKLADADIPVHAEGKNKRLDKLEARLDKTNSRLAELEAEVDKSESAAVATLKDELTEARGKVD